MRYDRARGSLDRHATYIVAAYVAGAARHPGPELTRPDGGCAALPPALIFHRYGDDPALRSFPDEDIRCPQIFALVRLVSNRGRVAGRPHPGL